VAVELHVGAETDKHGDLGALFELNTRVLQRLVDDGEREELLRLQLVLWQHRQPQPAVVDVDGLDEGATHLDRVRVGGRVRVRARARVRVRRRRAPG